MSLWRQPCCDDTNLQPALSCPYGWVSVIDTLNTPPGTPLYGYHLVGTQPTGDFAGHDNEYAWYVSGVWQFCAPSPGDKVTTNTCDHLCWNGSAWVTQSGGNGGQFTPQLLNVGGGSGVVGKQWSGSQLQLNTLRAGNNIQIVTDNAVGEVVINALIPPSGNGEVNTGNNVGGAGAGVFKNKTGAQLNFRRLYSANADLTISQEADRIKFEVNVPPPATYDVANVGGEEIELYRNFSAGIFNFKTLHVDSEQPAVFQFIPNGPDSYDIVFAPSLGDLAMFGDAYRLYDNGIANGDLIVWDTDSWIAKSPTVLNLGAGQGHVLSGFTALLELQARSIKAGANITITEDANEITITGAPAGVSSGANMGTGADGLGLYTGVISGVMQLKRIKAGTDIFLTSETNDILVAARSAVAGDGMVITPGATDNTFAVSDWLTLLSDAAVGDASIIKSGPPWLLRKLKSGTGILVTENSNDVTFSHALTLTNLGAGVGPLKDWSGAQLRGRTFVAGPGMDVQLVGDEVILSVTSGGGSGGGVSGTALVGQWYNGAAGPALDRWGLTATNVTFSGTALSVASVTKNGGNDEFTFNEAGKYKISAKATLTTGGSQTQHQMWCEVWTGASWAEVSGSRSWVYTTNEVNDLQTIHTGEFTLNITTVGWKIRFRVITSGGTVGVSVFEDGTAVTIERAVGPIWEVVADGTATRTLSVDDNGKVLNFTSGAAVTVTLPQTLLASFSCDIIQSGTGVVTLQTSGAATIQSIPGGSPRTVSAQYGRVRVIAVSGTGANAVYNLSGNIA